MTISTKATAIALAMAEILEVQFNVEVVRVGRMDPDEVAYRLRSGDQWSLSVVPGNCRIYKNWASAAAEELAIDSSSTLAKLAEKYASVFAYV